jgi:hypothetical protein
VLVVAGDPRSRSRLLDALADRSASVAVQVDHSGGASGDDLAAAVAEALRDVVTDARRAVLERYDQAAGRPDGLAWTTASRPCCATRSPAVREA